MPATIRLSYLHLLIFILVPGYVSLRGYLAGNLVLDDLSRTDKLIVIIIGGFASLCLVVFLHRANVPGWIYWAYDGVVQGQLNPHAVYFNAPVKFDSYNDISILDTAAILLAESAFAGIIGFGVGRMKMHPEDRENSHQSRRELRQPWEEAFEYAALDTEVTVITTNGDEINGTIEQLGSPSKDYDILLADPHIILRESDGMEYKRHKIGKHSYHHYRDISRIEFKSGFDYPQEEKSLSERFKQRLSAEWVWIKRRFTSEEEEDGEEVTSLSLEED